MKCNTMKLRLFNPCGAETTILQENQVDTMTALVLAPLLLKWFNFNPRMDKQLQPL